MFDHIIHFLLMAQFSAKDAVAKTRNEEGATAVEYGLLVALIAGVIVLAVTALGAQVNTVFTTVTGQI
jgi:pilus assembly protein Flp/PilA